jgi:hypothetical protein
MFCFVKKILKRSMSLSFKMAGNGLPHINPKPMKTFKEYIKSLDACEPAIDLAGDKPIEQIVAECHRGDWLLWLAKKCGVELQPLTLAKGHCANTVRHLMTDERSLKAVDAAIAFGEGKATREELDDAADAATAAAAYAYAADAAYAAYAAAAYAAHAADAAHAAYAAAAYAAHAANQQETADICRKYIGELIIQKVNQILNP